MNLELLTPYEYPYPEKIETRLEDSDGSLIKHCAFNRKGNLLATGSLNGIILIWDFDTKGIAKTLRGHISTITSLSWSNTGRCLLSSGLDGFCIYWDLQTGVRQLDLKFDTSIANACLHPIYGYIYGNSKKQKKEIRLAMNVEAEIAP